MRWHLRSLKQQQQQPEPEEDFEKGTRCSQVQSAASSLIFLVEFKLEQQYSYHYSPHTEKSTRQMKGLGLDHIFQRLLIS